MFDYYFRLDGPFPKLSTIIEFGVIQPEELAFIFESGSFVDFRASKIKNVLVFGFFFLKACYSNKREMCLLYVRPPAIFSFSSHLINIK